MIDNGFSLKRALGTSVFLGMLLMVLSACDDSGKKSSSSVRQAELPKVAVMEAAEREAKFTASTAARAVAFRVAEVRPQISGIIKKRLFTEGSYVKEGEILYLLDDAIYRAAYESAKADWVQAKANLVPLKLKRERSKAMLVSSSISQQDYDDANAAYLAGDAECISRKAAMDEASVRLGYTSITAPLSGEIGLSSVTEGALVTEHQSEKLSSIWQTDPMYVVMALPVAEWAKARSMAEEGLVEKETFGRVRIFLEDGTPYPGECRIDFSEVSAEESTGNILLRAAVSNPSRILLPRMALRAEVTLGISRHAVFLPQKVVQFDAAGEAFVFVLGKDNIAQKRHVRLGGVQKGHWHIMEGVSKGDLVIAEGLNRVREGVRVEREAEKGEKP